jgi:hypothetical protein
VSGVANEDERARVEVEITYVVLEFLVEFPYRCITSLQNGFFYLREILGSLVKLESACCDKVFSCEGLGEGWCKVGCFSEIKRKEGLESVCYIVR